MVGHMCCAYNCKEKQKKGGISFHFFPKDPERRRKWTFNIKRKGFIPNDFTKICAKHFKKECFDTEKFGGRWLKSTAEPTIFDFPSYLPYLQTQTTSKKPPLKRSSSPSESVLEDPNFLHHEQFETVVSEKAVLPKKKRYSYLGDFDSDCSPTKLKKKCEIAKRVIEKQKRWILNMRRKEQRLVKKVADLSSMLKELKEKNLISENAEDTLEKSMSGVAGEILRMSSKGYSGNKYSPEIRRFAMTLHFYSSKAYNYVRKVLNTCLPHPATLRKWSGVVEGSPGFTKDALTALKLKVDEAKGKEVLCALMMVHPSSVMDVNQTP